MRGETERVGLLSKLSRCPKMMVDLFVEGGGKTRPTHENYVRSKGRGSYWMNHPR